MRYLLFVIIFSSCVYKAGNREPLMRVLIETNVKHCMVRRYIDSIIIEKNLSFPDSLNSWVYFPSDAKYFPDDNKIIHFKTFPEEYYLISIDGDIRLNGIHNKDMRTDWIYDQKLMSQKELERVKLRLLKSVINPIGTIKDTICK